MCQGVVVFRWLNEWASYSHYAQTHKEMHTLQDSSVVVVGTNFMPYFVLERFRASPRWAVQFTLFTILAVFCKQARTRKYHCIVQSLQGGKQEMKAANTSSKLCGPWSATKNIIMNILTGSNRNELKYPLQWR